MICYLDRSFCSSDCVNTKCYRNYSPEHKAKAAMWAKGWADDSPPVAFADYKQGCGEYLPPKESANV